MTAFRDRSIALVGCVQHAFWAHRIAQHGEYRMPRLQSASESILCSDPAEALDVFGSVNNLSEGLQVSQSLLGKQQSNEFTSQEAAWLTGYVGQLLKLASVLLASSNRMTQLANSLEGVKPEGEKTIEALASVYVENISPLSPRIMIQGNGIYLQNDEFAAGIRTHLLAAIRSAVLWRQCGGRIWHLIFQRAAYLREIRQLQANIK